MMEFFIAANDIFILFMTPVKLFCFSLILWEMVCICITIFKGSKGEEETE